MVTSWRRMTSRFRHGLGTAGPPRPLQADTPVTWVTKVNNEVGYRTSYGRFPKRENRSLVLHSAAEENGVSMLRKGGHRTRDARAFRIVHRNHISKPHPRHHLTSRRSPESQGRRAGVGGDRARPEWRPRAPAKKTNTHPPQPVCFFGGPGTTESLFLQARVRDDDTAKCCRKAVTDRGDVVASHDVTISPRPRNRRPASPTSGRHSCDLGHQSKQRSWLPNLVWEVS